MTDKIVVLSTCASAEEAQRIARALVEKRLAACVNVIPGIRSIYHWKDAAGKDAIEDEEEVLLLVKTSRALLEELREEMERLHSYEVPEVIALSIVDGSERYLSWMTRELAHKPSL
ncbi:MAG: divalent-cation tolerance protein CutA [Bryobacteraceae bacterium]|jgi:periplasmic divalent cation tolerance protein